MVFPNQIHSLTLLAAILFAAHTSICAQESQSDEIQFNRDIRPILSDRCFQCHGPDAKKREADLRFDLEDEATKDLGGYHAIVPGKTTQSALIERIIAEDEDERMPPADSGKSLSAADIELLKAWIAQGAKFEKHWAFQSITRPVVPAVKDRNWPRNEIDHFILSTLENNDIRPSSGADRNTLIRRLSLDLIGLPPTPQEIAKFVKDSSPEAYERLVDRLLNSQHFGERIGRHWLDLARYADSNGYANDGLRSIWPYRDWVINALNNDMPFDQFTIEQLAGDLVETPNESQLIATGFHRNTPHQTEGGSDFEQYRVERTKNRTDTTGTVWLGLSVGCAQCHTHKFDPITHKEYYQLYSFFNSVDEPTQNLSASPETESAIASIKKQISEVDRLITEQKKLVETDRKAGKLSWSTLTFDKLESKGGATLTKLNDGSVLASGKNPAIDIYTMSAKLAGDVKAIRIETLTDKSLPKMGPGRAGNGNFVLAEITINSNGKNAKIVSAMADHSQNGYPVLDAFDGDLKSGWAINVSKGKMNVNRTAVFSLEETIRDDIQIKFRTYENGNGYNIGRFRISTSERAPPISKGDQLAVLETKKKRFLAELKKQEALQPKTLIVRERTQPRESFIQIRGDFLDPGKKVQPGTFTVLPPLTSETEVKPSRLDLAKWLTAPSHPLTARVQANRMWQHLFGVGLVETENDFGYQGSLPSHPELLDYLANELIQGQWKLKRIYKKIVTSATYRQSSKFREDLFQFDPKNRWLGKQNRYRVEGEIVRDLGLAASGLLSRKMGGPAVFPPIPPNVIGTSSARHRWPTSTGEDRYRRGIYTAIYRANVYPMLSAFDGPDRDNSCTRRSRSNTPLQALTIANDASFVEMAQAFGKRILESTATSREDRIRLAFIIALSRNPTDQELNRLSQFQQSRLKYYFSNSTATKQIAKQDSPELASWIALARLVINLDEFITRE